MRAPVYRCESERYVSADVDTSLAHLPQTEGAEAFAAPKEMSTQHHLTQAPRNHLSHLRCASRYNVAAKCSRADETCRIFSAEPPGNLRNHPDASLVTPLSRRGYWATELWPVLYRRWLWNTYRVYGIGRAKERHWFIRRG